MNTIPIKKIFIQTATLLTMALMVYAAVSKLIDFENFQVQLGQSPMLSAFAGWLAVVVPAVELVIAFLLAIPRTRLLGNIGASSLMTMFTVYIYIILNYGSYVPCSCGGVLENLGWREHLYFNSFFVLISMVAVVLDIKLKGCNISKKPLHLTGLVATLFLSSALLVTVLFISSENIIHHRNNFIRRYTASHATENREYDLKTPSYYFAGTAGNTIYLGNTLAPRHLLAIDTTFKKMRSILIDMDNMELPFRAVHIRVAAPYFFLTDGTVPCVFRGRISDWKAKLVTTSLLPFTHVEPIDSTHLAFRGIKQDVMESSLGVIDLKRKERPSVWKPLLLIPEDDGIFDTDGLLMRNGKNSDFHYIYYYRNEFFRMDSSLILTGRDHTIDTVYKANLKVKYLKGRHERKLAAVPKVVNKTAAAYGNLMFVNSNMIGRFEDEQMWRQASVIDVYDLDDGSYHTSFYVYHINKKPLRSFIIYGNTLFALGGNWMSAVPLNKNIIQKLKSKGHENITR